MKGRGFITLVGVVVGLAVAAPSFAATIRVNDDAFPVGCTPDFATIQNAVNAASSGDTIIVCPGYYNEGVVVNTDDLTIRGKNLPPDLSTCGATRTNTSSVAALKKYSVVQGFFGPSFSVYANGVTIDSFVIKGPNTFDDVGIYTDAGYGGYLLQNNLIQDNGGGVNFNADGSALSKMSRNCLRENNDAFGTYPGVGIFSDSLASALVQGNHSYNNNTASGQFTDQNTPPDSVLVQGNITNKDAAGYEMDGSTGSAIQGNIISGTTADGLCIGLENSGLLIQGNIIKLATGNGILFDFCNGFGAAANTGLSVTGNISTTAGNNNFWVINDDSLQNSTVSSNIFKTTGATAMWVDGSLGNGGNTFTGNIAQGGVALGQYGCRDDTVGLGTAGTANTWGDSNIGKPHNLPMALCFPHK